MVNVADKYSKEDIEVEAEEEDDDISIEYDIATYPSDFTLAGIEDMWKAGDITIPEYQREFVWSIKQSSLLIDSFLTGLPVPSVFFYIDEENKNLVIDGQQRILSVIFFFEGYFGKESTQGRRQVFRLTGLAEGSPYHGKRFQDLNEADQRKLKQAVLRAVNIRQLKPAEADKTCVYHIFERLNTGGTPLRAQEIRNVVFRGEFNKSLREANGEENWRKIIGRPYLDKHQRDVEFLLRVFSLVGNYGDYEKPMKEFLNKAMEGNRRGKSKKVTSFFDVFPKVTKMVVEQLGSKPFHIWGPLNISVLDSVMSTLIENYKRIDEEDLKDNYGGLIKDGAFEESTRFNTTDAKTVLARFSIVKDYLVGD